MPRDTSQQPTRLAATEIGRSVRTSPLALLLVSAALLAGCTPVPAPPAGPPSETPKPVETVEPAPALDPDVLLVVSAVATADSGAVLNLTMTVHKATAWNDPSAPDRPALMTSGCDGSFDESMYRPTSGASSRSTSKPSTRALHRGLTISTCACFRSTTTT